MSADELRARILAADEAGTDPFNDVVQLMKIDPIFDIGMSILIRTTMAVIEHQQLRTATMTALRYEALAA